MVSFEKGDTVQRGHVAHELRMSCDLRDAFAWSTGSVSSRLFVIAFCFTTS